MSRPILNVTNNMSIAWGMVLALVTILDWNSIERNPLEEEIFTPFISREVTVLTLDTDDVSVPGSQIPYQYNVELKFNGPLFLLYFFGPPAVLFLIGRVIGRANQIRARR